MGWFFAISLLAGTALPDNAVADWAPFGNQAAIEPSDQLSPKSISDGQGGMIVAWQDLRSGTADIYAQRFDASGNRLWGSTGLAICTFTEIQESPVLCSDGAGGAIIAWQDRRPVSTYDIYAQGVNANGTLKWLPSTGVPICTFTDNQILEVIASDGKGGAIIGWRDSRTGFADVYAQRLRSSGATAWAGDGVPICTATGQQNDIRIIPDQIGGAFLVWRDPRNSPADPNDVYAQSVDSTGTVRWASDGVVVANAGNSQLAPSISTDGRYGLLIAWQDLRNNTDVDIFVQRVKPDGTARWIANGVQACDVDNSQVSPLVVSDGLGGAIVAWTDSRTSLVWSDIYAQRIDSTGAVSWMTNGVGVCTADSSQFVRTLVADKLGGAIVGWDDERGAGNDEDIYTQALSSTGSLRWGAGIKIGTGANSRRLTSSAPDGYGGGLFAWEDFRNDGGTGDVYGIRITAAGTGVAIASAPRTAGRLLKPWPNPFNPHVSIGFTLEGESRFKLSIHDVRGRLVRVLAEGEARAGRLVYLWDGARQDGTPCASGAYFAVLELPSGTRSTTLTLVR